MIEQAERTGLLKRGGTAIEAPAGNTGLGMALRLHRRCNDLATGIEFLHALRQLGQRNQLSADVGDLVFVFLADVEQG